MGKTSKDKRDIYYRKAKEDGWRARSAFKLIHINEQFHIFDGVSKVVDLCAAPGGWSQVLSRVLYQQRHCEILPLPQVINSEKASKVEKESVKIVAVDLQPMAPLPGVIQLQGDITKLSTAQEIIQHFNGEKAHLVVCDGAPDVTGLHDMDVYLQSQLLLGAVYIACCVMQDNATFVAKIFRSEENDLLIQNQMRMLFKSVCITKPRSSRNSSIEAFVVCKRYKPPAGFDASLMTPYLTGTNKRFDALQGINRLIIPFLVSGDVAYDDSDANHPLNIVQGKHYSYLPPVQLPIDPPYKETCKSSSYLKKDSMVKKTKNVLEFPGPTDEAEIPSCSRTSSEDSYIQYSPERLQDFIQESKEKLEEISKTKSLFAPYDIYGILMRLRKHQVYACDEVKKTIEELIAQYEPVLDQSCPNEESEISEITEDEHHEESSYRDPAVALRDKKVFLSFIKEIENIYSSDEACICNVIASTY